MRTSTLMVFMVLFAGQLWSAGLTTSDLQGMCRKGLAGSRTSALYLGCVGYVRGFTDATVEYAGEFLVTHTESLIKRNVGKEEAVKESGGLLDNFLGYCAPDGVQIDQIAKIFLKYADDHPEQLHKGAIEVLRSALRKAFPCESKK